MVGRQISITKGLCPVKVEQKPSGRLSKAKVINITYYVIIFISL